jgi:hypothetical protein
MPGQRSLPAMPERWNSRKVGSRSISRVLSWTAIPLGVLLPARSSSLPGSSASHAHASLFGLAPDGVCRAVRVTTAAVSSYLAVSPLPAPLRENIGGLISVALSVTSRCPVVNRHPALRSPDFPLGSRFAPLAQRLPDRLPGLIIRRVRAPARPELPLVVVIRGGFVVRCDPRQPHQRQRVQGTRAAGARQPRARRPGAGRYPPVARTGGGTASPQSLRRAPALAVRPRNGRSNCS